MPENGGYAMPVTTVETRTILVVEDDHDVNGRVCDALDKAGYEPLAAFDGDQALRMAAAHHPALILLDLNLPDSDGVHICRTLHKAPVTRGIPVIVFTGRTDLTSKFSCFVAGARHYLTKPVDRHNLLNEVRLVLDPDRP